MAFSSCLLSGGITCSFATLTNAEHFQVTHPRCLFCQLFQCSRKKTSSLGFTGFSSSTALTPNYNTCISLINTCISLVILNLPFHIDYKSTVLPIGAFNCGAQTWFANQEVRKGETRENASLMPSVFSQSQILNGGIDSENCTWERRLETTDL